MTAPEDQTLEELQEKLKEYESALEQVSQRLAENPSDPMLGPIENDLRTVVALYSRAISYKTNRADDDDIPELGYTKGPDVSDEVLNENLTSPVKKEKVHIQVGTAAVGRTCRVVVHGEAKFGEVQSVTKDPTTNDSVAKVVLIGTDQETLVLPAQRVHLLHPVQPALLIPGTKAQAIFSEDGLWYDCEIEEQTTTGYNVVYTHYGNREEVLFDRVRLPNPKESRKKRKVKEVTTKGGYVIPENLQILPTDTEHQKQVKKKRMNALKKEQKKDTIESESRQKQGVWLTHARGASARAKTGFGKGKNKDSIFRTTDLPEARVGVTRSGMGMTSYLTKQKHEFEAVEENNV